MRIFTLLLSVTLLSSFVLGQKAKVPAELKPSPAAMDAAQANGAEPVKLIPRGKYQDNAGTNPLNMRGGGSYYSFTTGSHSYDRIPQIALEADKLSTGFYGASYGFIRDLGAIKFSEIATDNKAAEFLKNYTPPSKITEIRSEQSKRFNYNADGVVFSNSLGAIVGHTYLLRSISFSEADTLVALQVVGLNDDGSLEFIWKPVKTFPTPVIADPANDPLRRERETKTQ